MATRIQAGVRTKPLESTPAEAQWGDQHEKQGIKSLAKQPTVA